MARKLPQELLFTSETTFRLSADTYLEPDFVFYPKLEGWEGLSATTARLVVEIADTSLAYDMGRKAGLYAAFSIVELWVINAVTLQTRIHRDPTSTGYRSIVDLPPGERLVPELVPALALVFRGTRTALIARGGRVRPCGGRTKIVRSGVDTQIISPSRST